MITVTPSLATTILIPAAVTDGGTGTVTPTLTAPATAVLDGFSTALNMQKDLLIQLTTNASTLATPTEAATLVVTTDVTAPAITQTTASTLQQVATSTANLGLILVATNTPVATPETAMSVTDTEILSSVTDTLKYITAGLKLGDNLITEQSVQLPIFNPETPLTQQSVQSTTEQVVQNKQVISTPSTNLVQQAIIDQPTQQVAPQQVAPQQVVTAKQETIAVKIESTQTDPSLLLAELSTLDLTQNISIKDSTVSTTSKSETKKTENQDVSIVVIAQQVMPEIVAPIVIAQTATIDVEAPQPTFEPVKADEKQTLTPAKNLLMDAVANRSNTNGDTANNSSNKSANQALSAEVLLKTTDNKIGTVDTKSFSSVLITETSDSLSMSSATSTSDKSTPQNISSAVNKLVQDTKVDVPAMTRPLSHPAWNQEMGERIVWMSNQGISSAEIKMNPQNMGPITVRIDMNQDQATISFTAQNSEVRTALEASIPKLREMLGSQNVTLADVNVSQQSSSNTNSDSSRSQQQAAQMAADASANGQGNRQNKPELDTQGNSISQVDVNGNEITVDEFENGQEIGTNGINGLLSVHA
ncbi:MAG: flagellar hook-length control protein FliK [Methylococcales bacterium]|nr:flagellar hook-length control protein FliK [Methylococcales bacterium]